MVPATSTSSRIESNEFDAATQHFTTTHCETMTPEQRAKLTGLFNQATKGDCRGNRPTAQDSKGRMEFDYWALVLGMSADDAKYAYVKLLKEVDPSFDVNKIKFPKSPPSLPQSQSNKSNSLLPTSKIEQASDSNTNDTNIVTNIYDVIHPASEASSSEPITIKVTSSPNLNHSLPDVYENQTSDDFWKYQTELVEEVFELAVKHASTPSCKNASNDQKAKLYGCFKQANKGDCTGSRPGVFDQIGRFKYDAWATLKGHTRNDACIAYVETVMEIDSFWVPLPLQSPRKSCPSNVVVSGGQDRSQSVEGVSRPSLRPILKPPKKKNGHGEASRSNRNGQETIGRRQEGGGASFESSGDSGSEQHLRRSRSRSPSKRSKSRDRKGREHSHSFKMKRKSLSLNGSNGGDVTMEVSEYEKDNQTLFIAGLSFSEFFFLNLVFLTLLGLQCFYFQYFRPKHTSYLYTQFLSSILLNICFVSLICQAIFKFKQLSDDDSRQIDGEVSKKKLNTKTSSLDVVEKKEQAGIVNDSQSDSQTTYDSSDGSQQKLIQHENVSSPSTLPASPLVVTRVVPTPMRSREELISLFQGNWLKDLNRSDSQNEHMIAIGVPWLVRAAINRSSQETEISTDGNVWIETTTNLGGRKVQTLQLDGSMQERRNPLDLSPVTMTSSFRSDGCVVTESAYLGMGIKQVLTRRVHRCEDIPVKPPAYSASETPPTCRRDVYHVTNVMTLKDGTVLVAHSYFDRLGK